MPGRGMRVCGAVLLVAVGLGASTGARAQEPAALSQLLEDLAASSGLDVEVARRLPASTSCGEDATDECDRAAGEAERIRTEFADAFDDAALLDAIAYTTVVGLLPGADDRAAFPALRRLTPVVVRLAERASESDGTTGESAATAMRDLIGAALALDLRGG